MTIKEQIAWCKAQIKNGYEPVVIRSILERLQALQQKEPPHEYHNQAVTLYKAFLTHHKLPELMDGRQGKALKEILTKLQEVSHDRTPLSAYESFRTILIKWHLTGEYLSKKKSLTAIRDNLLEIIDKIKHGATKQQANVNEAEQLANRIKNKYTGGA